MLHLKAAPKKASKRCQKRKLESGIAPIKEKKMKPVKKIKPVKQKLKNSKFKSWNEFSESESNRTDFSSQQLLDRIPSNNSVIYVQTFYYKENVPVIDLTQSSHSSLFSNQRSVKLIYSSDNLRGTLDKRLTTSLLQIPSKKYDKLKKTNSISNLTKCSRERLSILDIPPEFLDEDTDESEYVSCDLSHSDLNEDDHKIIEMITLTEDDNSSDNLEPRQPIEKMYHLYGVSSNDTFHKS